MNGLELLKMRLDHAGGQDQRARMIKGKRKSLDQAILYSYQGATVCKIGETNNARCLITPNQVKPDYDDKNLSIGFEYGYKPGDVFEWLDTKTKWIIYLQDLTELAYFRGDIRKCSYEISWEDKNGEIQTTYGAIRGPKETSLSSIQKFGFSMDLPNYTLSLLLPNRKNTVEQFQRYSKFYLKNLDDNTIPVCWRVEAIDSISLPGVLEVYATEYYINAFEDDLEQGVVGGLIEEPAEQITNIIGDSVIRPKKTYTYIYSGQNQAQWLYDTSLPIEVKIDDKQISVKWLNNYSGQFDLSYGDEIKTITVESLF